MNTKNLGILAVVLVALIVGVLAGIPVGRSDPVVPPTPTPTPVPPKWWPQGLPYSEAVLMSAASRLAPIDPTGNYSSTIKVTVGGSIPVTCQNEIRGQQYLPDFYDARDGKVKCAGLATQAISINREIELAKINSSKEVDLARIEADREIELAKLLPTPSPVPAPAVLEYRIRGSDLVLKAIRGQNVIALFANPGPKVFLLDQKWVMEPVTYLEDAWTEKGTIHVTYVGSAGQYVEYDYTLPTGWSK